MVVDDGKRYEQQTMVAIRITTFQQVVGINLLGFGSVLGKGRCSTEDSAIVHRGSNTAMSKAVSIVVIAVIV